MNLKLHTGIKNIPVVNIQELTMKLQKDNKTSNLEQASTLLNELEDSELNEVSGGTNYPFGVPLGSPGGPWPVYGLTPVMQRHDSLN